eukprot:13216971-Heterocapsa_arctica.AAC.1
MDLNPHSDQICSICAIRRCSSPKPYHTRELGLTPGSYLVMQIHDSSTLGLPYQQAYSSNRCSLALVLCSNTLMQIKPAASARLDA